MTRAFARGLSRRGVLGVIAGLLASGQRVASEVSAQDRCTRIIGNACPSDLRCFSDTCSGNRCCSGICTNVLSDPNNCGDCGVSCPRGSTCANGQCVLRCDSNQIPCGDVCINPNADSDNCGACGNVCEAGSKCRGGTCVSVCESGKTWCGDRCVDLSRNENNCGACGNVCPGGTECRAGVCESVCPGSETWCGACVDLGTSEANCGACGNACPEAQQCVDGTCVLQCSGGLTACAGECVDVAADTRHCGACGTACPPGSTCLNGGCLIVEEGQEVTTVRDMPGLEFCTADPVAPKRLAKIVEILTKPAPDRRLTTGDADALVAGLEPLADEDADPYRLAVDGALGCGNGGDLERLLGAMTPEAGAEFVRGLGWPTGPDIMGLIAGMPMLPQRQRSGAVDGADVFTGADGRVLMRRWLIDPQRLEPLHQRLFMWPKAGRNPLGAPSMVIQDAWTEDAGFSVRLRTALCPAGMDEPGFLGDGCPVTDGGDPQGVWEIYPDDGTGRPGAEAITWENGVAPFGTDAGASGRAWLRLVSGAAVVPGLIQGQTLDAALAGWWIVPLTPETPDRIIDVYLLS